MKKKQKSRIFESRKNKIFTRKAQLQIMENTFVLIVIFFILALVLVFVMAFQRSEYKQKMNEYKDLELIKKSQVLNFLPEMQCSDNNDIDPDCYDILKIDSFTEQLQEDNFYYQPLMGNVKILIKKYDPSPNIEAWTQEWLVYDNPTQEFIDQENFDYRELQFPVLLRDVRDNSNYFGVIFLGVYG